MSSSEACLPDIDGKSEEQPTAQDEHDNGVSQADRSNEAVAPQVELSAEEPGQEIDRRNATPAQHTGRPDLEIIFEDNSVSQRVITVTHYTPSGAKSEVTLNAETDSDTKVACGDLHILITKGNPIIVNIPVIKTELAPGPSIEIASATSGPAPSTDAGLLTVPPKTSRGLDQSSSPKVSPKPPATNGSTSLHTSKEPIVRVILTDYKYDSEHLRAYRKSRIKSVLKRYARKRGMDYKNLVVMDCDEEVDLNTRLGTIVKRHIGLIGFTVVDKNNDAEYNPYSEYEDS